MARRTILLLAAIAACTPTRTTTPRPPPAGDVFDDWSQLPASIRGAIDPSVFAANVVVRLTVDVGCRTPQTATCTNFGWGAKYEARCKSGVGSERVVKLAKLADLDLWPDGYVPKAGEFPAFSWHVASDGARVDVPSTIGCDAKLHPGATGPYEIVRDVYWLVLPKTTPAFEPSPYEGSDLCMCVD